MDSHQKRGKGGEQIPQHQVVQLVVGFLAGFLNRRGGIRAVVLQLERILQQGPHQIVMFGYQDAWMMSTPL
jgi:hypothetical protein